MDTLGIDRKAMLVIEKAELSALRVERELQFPAIQDGAVLIAEHRDKNFSLQFVF